MPLLKVLAARLAATIGCVCNRGGGLSEGPEDRRVLPGPRRAVGWTVRYSWNIQQPTNRGYAGDHGLQLHFAWISHSMDDES